MEWFNAKENLPQYNGRYLTVIRTPEVKGNTIFYKNRYDFLLYSTYYGWVGAGDCEILKWIPLPDPDEVVTDMEN